MKHFFISLGLSCMGVAAVQADDRPNIINIVVDDLGYADMSFQPVSPADVSTPGIDRLRSLGAAFDYAYATSPICSPSRAGLITGRYQQRWGNYWYSEGGLPLREVTLPEALQANGYRTKMIGKSHHNGGDGYHPLDHGFEEFLGFIHHTHDYLRLSEKDVQAYGPANARLATIGPLIRDRDEPISYEGRYLTDILTEEAIEFISRPDEAKPYYLRLNYNAVHHPTYVGDPKQLAKFGLDQFPFWDPEEMPWDEWHQQWGWMGEIDPDGRKRYLAALASMDEGISRILETLEKEAGGLEDTIIVFSSDNGGTINTYSNNEPLRGFKFTFHEGGLRIPLIIAWPGQLPAGGSHSQLVSAMDVFPTLLELSGSSSVGDRDGKSLAPILRGEQSATGHDSLVFCDDRGNWVVRQGKWRLFHSEDPLKKPFKAFEYASDGQAARGESIHIETGLFLYDVESDPGETRNLAERQPRRVAELRKIYEAWKAQMPAAVRVRQP